ncbi:hypothetical protein T439DRAFT_327065 [Meredithblackwellia eburnea MCA 4105]
MRRQQPSPQPPPGHASQQHQPRGGVNPALAAAEARRTHASAGGAAGEPIDPERQSSLSTLYKLSQELETLRTNFHPPPVLEFQPGSTTKLAFTSGNAPFHAHEDALVKLLTKLDGVESNGDEVVRGERKKLVREVEKELEMLDGIKKAQAERGARELDLREKREKVDQMLNGSVGAKVHQEPPLAPPRRGDRQPSPVPPHQQQYQAPPQQYYPSEYGNHAGPYYQQGGNGYRPQYSQYAPPPPGHESQPYRAPPPPGYHDPRSYHQQHSYQNEQQQQSHNYYPTPQQHFPQPFNYGPPPSHPQSRAAAPPPDGPPPRRAGGGGNPFTSLPSMFDRR